MLLLKVVLAWAVLGVTAAAARSVAPATPFACGVWSGNVSATSASVVVRLNSAGQKVRLRASTEPDLTPAVWSSTAITTASAGNAVSLTVEGLIPDTDYYYGVEVDGVLRDEGASRGRLRTFPLGPGSFKIAFASCSDFRAADQSAFDAILAARPLLFIHMGDLHYSDTSSANPDDYRANYDAVLNQPNQAAMYRGVPLVYMWDDHDFCGNDSDVTSPGRAVARAVYQERTPHYPIAPAAGGTMAQAFTVGRVRIIVTDLRSAADPSTKKDDGAKTHLGIAQKNWFKQQLISARDAGFPLILWVCTNPWIGAGDAAHDTDNWSGYAAERTELANFIRDNRIQNLVLLSGDMHALAYDDGTHSDYATGGGAQLTVLHAASLTQNGSIKGGPYTSGPIPGGQQYGILEVYDRGGPSLACRFVGMHAHEGQKLSYIFSAAAPVATDLAIANTSTLTRLAAGDALVSGFVISGRVPRTILVRAVGPTLASYGITDPVMQPVLSLYHGATKMAASERWDASDDSASLLNDAFARAGAFPLNENGGDAALLLTLEPGAYSVRVKNAGPSAGATLVELYAVP
jgi:phosphodiesterase/alkaline phosphatase D-like protein